MLNILQVYRTKKKNKTKQKKKKKKKKKKKPFDADRSMGPLKSGCVSAYREDTVPLATMSEHFILVMNMTEVISSYSSSRNTGIKKMVGCFVLYDL